MGAVNSGFVFQFTPPRGGRPSSWGPGYRPTKFQFTPPRGGRRGNTAGSCSRSRFQFTPPRGGRRDLRAAADEAEKIFQFTPPRGGRHLLLAVHVDDVDISIHAPAWGATPMPKSSAHRTRHFNSRPRVGGDLQVTHSAFHRIISIHAPAWGATLFASTHFSTQFISIHAPAWGATRERATQPAEKADFNSRPRVGGDLL